MTAPGLDKDQFSALRAASTTDGEGNATGDLTEAYSGLGTLGSPSTRDATVAAAAGMEVTEVLAVELPAPDTIQPGDVIDVRAQRFDVTHVRDVRHHYRVFLRRTA